MIVKGNWIGGILPRSFFVLGCVLSAAAGAQQFPVKPVRVVNPAAPGGNSDIFFRILSPKMGELLGQQLVIDYRPGAGGIVGAGFDELRWPLPVRPGDELRVESEILEVRPLKSRADRGVVKVKTTTLNQKGEAVQVSVGNLFVPRRPL